jgi:hypothetical protein
VTTLYSRAQRVVLDGASWLLRALRKDASFDLLAVATVGMLVEPAFELFVSLE